MDLDISRVSSVKFLAVAIVFGVKALTNSSDYFTSKLID